MYQYLQGWKIDERDYRWALGFSNWTKGLDLYGQRVWIEFDGTDCVVRKLWDTLHPRKLVKIVWLHHGFYAYRIDDMVFVIYRFAWSLNRNKQIDDAYRLDAIARHGCDDKNSAKN